MWRLTLARCWLSLQIWGIYWKMNIFVSLSAFFSSIFWKVAMTIMSIRWRAVNMMSGGVLMRSTAVFSVGAGVPFQPWMKGFCLPVRLSNEALQSHTHSAQLLDYIIPGDVHSSQSPCIVIFSASTLRSLFCITLSSLTISSPELFPIWMAETYLPS